MVNVSTLFYVLENLEGEAAEAFDLDEILEMEQKYIKGLFDRLDQDRFEVRPAVIQNILRTASTL
jgi:hypothetical protein